MDKEGILQSLFSAKGEEFGFDDVTAGFSPERDMKIIWMRSADWVDFWVSDYLEDAPEEVLESVADTIYSRIRSKEGKPYSEALVDYVTGDGFLRRNCPLYLSRINGVSKGPEGRRIDLSESYERLLKKRVLEHDPDIAIRWAPMLESEYAGHSSILMKTVCINRKLDSKFVSDEVIDFILFSQLAFVQEGFEQDPSRNIRLAQETLMEYPGYDRLMKEVKSMGLKLWKEVSPAD